MESSILLKCEQVNPHTYCFYHKNSQQIYALSQEIICQSANIDIALTDPSLRKKYGRQWTKVYGYSFLPALILALIMWFVSENLFYTFYVVGVYLLLAMFPFMFYYLRTRRKLQKLCQFETKIFGQAFINEVPRIDGKYLFR